MDHFTYRDLIRKYADMVENGTSDRDITNPRVRRLVALMLRTASNAFAGVIYPPSDRTRDDVVKMLQDLAWNGNLRLFIEAVSPSSGDAFDDAMVRTIVILRGI